MKEDMQNLTELTLRSILGGFVLVLKKNINFSSRKNILKIEEDSLRSLNY